MGRYEPLTRFLEAQEGDAVRVSFGDLERVLGRELPRSAATHRAFWSNNPSNNVMTRAWLAAGFQSEQVDLPGRTLIFRRVKEKAEMSGFHDAQTPIIGDVGAASEKLALFGWQEGTVKVAPGFDLCSPADPDWADLIDDLQAPAA